MKIAILYNIVDDTEYMDEDCLVQLNELETALNELNINYEKFIFTYDLSTIAQKLLDYRPNLAFNFVENSTDLPAIDHLPPLLLDGLNIPYTGGNAVSFIMTTNKLLSKQNFTKFAIATPEWRESNTFNFDRQEDFDNPLIIKNYLYDSSYGISRKSIVHNTTELLNFLENDAEGVKNHWFAERYIDGREFHVSMLSCSGKPKTLPIAELILSKADGFSIYDYKSKWDKNSKEYWEVKRSFEFEEKDKNLLEELKKISLKCWDIFKLKGYARIDYRVDKNNKIWVLEINANPAFVKKEIFIAAAEKIGLSYNDVVSHMIQEALYGSVKRQVSPSLKNISTLDLIDI